MPTIAEVREKYPQYSDMSDADLASALHRKFYADMPKADFDAKLGLKAEAPKEEPDPYRDAARTRLSELKAKGIPIGGSDVGRRFLQGASFNTADEILAGLTTPLEMIRNRTFNPAEGYRNAKAMQDALLEDARKEGGVGGTAMEILGGVGTGVGLARAGLTTARALAPNAGIGARTASSAADAGGMGLLSGLAEGNSLTERGQNAVIGGGLGAGLGALAPGAIALGGTVLSPLISNIRARINPQGYAESQIARGVTESGRTPQQIAGEVGLAAQEGQPMFTVADAMGNPGQRLLSSTARAPGPGRTQVVEFLEDRQGGQGRRVAGALAEGFDTPQTAAQTRQAMTQARDDAADMAYGAARQNAAPVDVSGVIARIDDTLQPGVNQIARPQSGIASDTVEAALEGVRRRLTDGRSVLTDFTALQRVRGDVSDMIQTAQRQGQGNRARMLGQVLGELDRAMEQASQGFRQANRNFAQSSRNIDAIDEGTTAAMRGRTEDIVPRFQGLTPEGQGGFRAGYVDPLIQQAQGAAFGVNRARPLTSDAFRDEAAAMAPGNPLLQRRLGRENVMFETRRQATGGSQTADNLADQGAMGVDPTIMGQLLTGNIMGAVRSTLASGSNILSGNTPQVRQAVADFLLQRGPNVSPQALQRTLDDAMRRIEQARRTLMLVGRAGAGGLATAPPATTELRR
jgi:hypothetical protein